jgi:hypothetical protein
MRLGSPRERTAVTTVTPRKDKSPPSSSSAANTARAGAVEQLEHPVRVRAVQDLLVVALGDSVDQRLILRLGALELGPGARLAQRLQRTVQNPRARRNKGLEPAEIDARLGVGPGHDDLELVVDVGEAGGFPRPGGGNPQEPVLFADVDSAARHIHEAAPASSLSP